ncbi:hypothetical protein EFY87_15940 [Flexivirga caeni]|uniref:2'-5' RNA ligase family protein n=1 Tax=Flexivirga caeni TaxID=2294115 RepID=A0A3M9M2U0_9MICO|nr:hypothetical protein EFY87_15940 [Flexivirga caeni]
MFDQLFEDSRLAVLRGKHGRDKPPADGGRWPVSVIASTDPTSFSARLQDLLDELTEYTGPGHFRTGRAGASHITVRALEPYREAASRDDLIVGEWTDAMKRTAVAIPAFDLAWTGVTLTRGGVLAQLEPHDRTPWELLDRFRSELGELAWFEDQWMKRNIWYSSIIHFAAEIREPRALVDWIAKHRQLDSPATTVRVTGLDLVRFHHTIAPETGEQYMRLSRWNSVELAG